MTENTNQKFDSPADLTAIMVAAHRTGDKCLERVARQQLEKRFGMRVSFLREAKPKEVAHA